MDGMDISRELPEKDRQGCHEKSAGSEAARAMLFASERTAGTDRSQGKIDDTRNPQKPCLEKEHRGGSMDDMRNPLAAPMAQRAARARSTRTFRDARMTACTGDDRTTVTAGAVAAVS